MTIAHQPNDGPARVKKPVGRPPKREEDRAICSGVRFHPSLFERLKAEAEISGRSMNAEMARRLEVSLTIPRDAFNGRVSPVTENEWLAAYKRALRSKLRRMEDRS